MACGLRMAVVRGGAILWWRRCSTHSEWEEAARSRVTAAWVGCCVLCLLCSISRGLLVDKQSPKLLVPGTCMEYLLAPRGCGKLNFPAVRRVLPKQPFWFFFVQAIFSIFFRCYQLSRPKSITFLGPDKWENRAEGSFSLGFSKKTSRLSEYLSTISAWCWKIIPQ